MNWVDVNNVIYTWSLNLTQVFFPHFSMSSQTVNHASYTQTLYMQHQIEWTFSQ